MFLQVFLCLSTSIFAPSIGSQTLNFYPTSAYKGYLVSFEFYKMMGLLVQEIEMHLLGFVIKVSYYIQITLDGASSHWPAQVAMDKLPWLARSCVKELWDCTLSHLTL